MLRRIRSWFTPTPTNDFQWNPESFKQARRWAKSQPHPEVAHLSLWDYVNGEWVDSEYKLHTINSYRKNKIENEKSN